MLYSREIPVKYTVDVFVAGGGPAGFTAAVAAARQGKTVFLAENNGCFGGSGTAALVPGFAQFTDGKDFLVGGIGREIRDAILGKECDFRRGLYTYSHERLKQILDGIAVQEKNLHFSFFTKMIDVVASGEHVDCVILAAKSGIFAVKAKIYIDGTGDGDLCAWAGAPFEYGNEKGEAMPPTLCCTWSHIDYDAEWVDVQQRLEEAIETGEFFREDRHLPGIFCTDRARGIGAGNVGHTFGVHGTDEVSLTQGMLEGRRILEEYERFYKKHIPGYENMYLCYTAEMLGVRESRRIMGDYCLSGEDFRQRSVFPDEIGRYAYPVDIHIMSPDKKAYDAYHKEFTSAMRYGIGESYGIPYRILTPQKLSNVLVAGRCVSTDRQMQASIRVMPGCYITGQAAGTAAALACEKEDVRAFPIALLQKTLVESGCVLPNFER